MKNLPLLVLLVWAPPALAQHIAPTDAKSPEDERKTFALPPGFEAQLVASEPSIDKPMQIAFDAKGRLWVTTSRLYPFPAEAGKASDRLFILSDFDATGKAKSIQTFDDKLNIPIGILPLADGKSCIVSSCGEILKLTDTDGDGKADKREVLYTGFGFKDTHGMTNSFTDRGDGWIYACHGFSNESTVKGSDGHVVKMQSGHTFRFKLDGSRIEIFTRGQVNPFGMTVDPWGQLYTADCHSKPITQLIRGAYYDSFGKPHDGLGYAPHVTKHDHGSTALCGLAWYTGTAFPHEYRDRMFLGNVVTNRINSDSLIWHGSTPVAEEKPDFLVSSDPWFRPTDIKLGQDGALYVSDFYNKIIGHYEVDLKHPERDKSRGRVWRIVYTKPVPKDGEASLRPSTNSIEQRKHLDTLIANPRGEGTTLNLLSMMNSIDPTDTHLVHAAKIALRNTFVAYPETLQNPQIYYAYENAKQAERLVDIYLGMTTPEAMEHLARILLFSKLDAARESRIAEQLGRYGQAYTYEFVRAFLNRRDLDASRYSGVATMFIQGLQTSRVELDDDFSRSMMIWARKAIDSDRHGDRLIAMNLMAKVTKLDQSQVNGNATQATFEMVAGKLHQPKVSTEEKLVACDTMFAMDKRLAVNRLKPFAMNVSDEFVIREKAILIVGTSREINNLIAMKDAIKSAPYRIAISLAVALAADRFGADLLLAAVKTGDAPAQLLTERAVRDRLKASGRPEWEATVNEMTKGLPTPDAKLAKLIANRATAYPKHTVNEAAGKELFVKNCANCHQLASQGGKVGPNLDGIGIRGVDRLLEDVLDPNRNVDAAFRATKLQLTDGREVTGLLVREEGDVLVMADNDGKEQRFRKGDVEKRLTLATSPMPADWGDKLKERELLDLMGFLVSQKAK